MKKKFLYCLKNDLLFKLVIFITVIVHGAMLLKYDVISFEKDKQCQNECIPNIEQVSYDEPDIVFENERNILILYDDTYSSLDTFNSMIQEKIECDICEISYAERYQIDDYDLILLGNTVIDNQPSESMINFLEQYDFSGLDVAPYWVGGMDHDLFESTIQSYIQGGDILPGLGFNSDEISETEEIDYFIDGWLTTVYTST